MPDVTFIIKEVMRGFTGSLVFIVQNGIWKEIDEDVARELEIKLVAACEKFRDEIHEIWQQACDAWMEQQQKKG